MRKIYHLIPAMFILSITNAFCLNVFQKAIGGTEDEDVRRMVKTSDGNFLIAGSTLSYGAGSTDAYLLKLDENGNVLWSKTYGEADDDFFEWLEETNDLGFILCGYSFSVSKQASKIIVMKTDSAGTIQWQKQVALSTVARAYCIKQTFDRGYILCGEEDSTSADGNLLILKLDSLGNWEWNKSYGIPLNADAGMSIIQTRDSAYALCGQSRYGFNSSYAQVLKTDALGNLVWSNNYFYLNAANSRSYPASILELQNGHLLVAGSSYYVGQPLNNVMLFEMDSSGAVQWSNVYTSGAGDIGQDLIPSWDNSGYYLCGYSSSPNTGTTNALLMKTDINGNYLWNECYGNDTLDGFFYSGAIKDSSKLILSGVSYAYGAGGQDIFIAGRDTSPFTPECNTHSVTFNTLSFPLTDAGPLDYYPLSVSVDPLNFSVGSGALQTNLCIGTGLNDVAANDKLQLYPDPASDEVFLESLSGTVTGYTIYSSLGTELKKYKGSGSKKLRIALNDIAQGIYFISIETGLRQAIIKCFIRK